MQSIQRFGRYTVTGTLGSGSMGEVYSAVDDVLGRTVAIKTLRSGTTGLAAQMIDERFRTEARAIAALNHPGIVQVYDIDLTADPPYLVMERLVGPSLRDRFKRGPLAPNELRALGIQIARALATAHGAGIVHRDVKPANIIIAGEGAWKLADFGVAHVPDSSLTMTGQFIGSPAYAPPEAMLRGECKPWGDVFGLGATLYHGAVGRWPRLEETTGALLARIPSVRTLVPDLPADLVEIIDRSVEIEPASRPSATELADRLARGSSSPPRVSVETEFVPDHAPSPRAPRAPTPPQADATVVLPDRPHDRPHAPDVSATATVPDRRSYRRVIAIAAIALVAVLVVVLATRSKSSVAKGPVLDAGVRVTPDAAVVAPAVPDDAEPLVEDLPPPGQIRAVTPPMTDLEAQHDWDGVVEALYEQDFEKAAERLAHWEARWGVTKETTSLRRQLARLFGAHE